MVLVIKSGCLRWPRLMVALGELSGFTLRLKCWVAVMNFNRVGHEASSGLANFSSVRGFNDLKCRWLMTAMI